MDYNIAFAPELPLWLITVVLTGLAIPVLLACSDNCAEAGFACLAFAALTLALLNPSLLVEDREALKSIVAVVTDTSSSQRLDGRAEQSEAAKGRPDAGDRKA